MPAGTPPRGGRPAPQALLRARPTRPTTAARQEAARPMAGRGRACGATPAWRPRPGHPLPRLRRGSERRGPCATCAVRARPARSVPDPHGPPNVRSRYTGDLRTGAPGRIRTRCRSGNITWQRCAETASAARLRAVVAARAPFAPARSTRTAPPAVGSGAEPLSGTALPLAPTSCPPSRGGYPQLPPHSTPSEANLERIDPAPTSRRDPAREPRRLLRTHCLHLRGDRLGGRSGQHLALPGRGLRERWWRLHPALPGGPADRGHPAAVPGLRDRASLARLGAGFLAALPPLDG